jgi:hypothetical protein
MDRKSVRVLKFIGNALLMFLLLGMVSLPATSFGLLKMPAQSSEVLSAKDVKLDVKTPESSQSTMPVNPK